MADPIVSTPATVMLTSAGSSGPVAVTVVSEAGAASQLMDGVLLEGQAQARASKGLLEVMTANGTLTLKAAPGATLPAIPAGAQLTLQVVGQGNNSQLFLVGINGRLLAGAATLPNLVNLLNQGGAIATPGQTGGVLGGGVLGGAPQPGQGGPLAGAGATPGAFNPAALSQLGLTATVIRPASAGGAFPLPPGGMPPGLPADLPAGTRLTVRIAGVEPHAPDGQQAGTPAQPAMPGGAATPGTGQQSPAAGQPQPAGQGAPRPNAPQQPQDAQVPSLPAQSNSMPGSPLVLGGTVTAHPPNGQAVVQTAVATLSVPTQADLPVGTRLTLEVVGAPQPPLPAPGPAAARPEGLGQLGWPALSDALDTLAANNQPQALEQLLRAIPQPDGRLAAAMVAFTGAVRDGSPRALLSDSTVRGLDKAGKKDVAARLGADLQSLTEESGRPVGNGDWRVYTMPMMHGGVVEPVRLFVRKPAGDDGNGKSGGTGNKGNDHRFVLDFNLTQLGRLQLDGLVRREDKLFDLIIRSGESMGPDMRRDILAIFHDASELVGTKGTVTFQAGGRWMEFPPAPPAPTRIEA